MPGPCGSAQASVRLQACRHEQLAETTSRMSNTRLKPRDLQLQLPVDQVHAMHTLCDSMLHLHTTASSLCG